MVREGGGHNNMNRCRTMNFFLQTRGLEEHVYSSEQTTEMANAREEDADFVRAGNDVR